MGKVVKAVVGVVVAVVGVVTGNPWLIAAGAALVVASALPTVKVPSTTNAATEQRLSKRLEPEAFRKIVFGRTALASDIRYWEVHGTGGKQYSEVIAGAAHRIHSFGDLYFAEEKVTFSGTAGTGKWAGILQRRLKTEGARGGAITLGNGVKWNVNSTMTGCAHYALEFLYSQEKWPQGFPSRYTQEAEGAPVYDPRRDVSRGGTHVITDQTTWEYGPLDSNGQPIGRNNALQMLWYLIGWRVTNPDTAEKVVVAGRGVDPADINLDGFITAANNCETMEWYSDCVLSTGDSHSTNESILKAASAGELLDTGGRFSYWVAIDDTSDAAVILGQDDITGPVQWIPKGPMDGQFNEVAGSFVDPAALYQSRPYPLVRDSALQTAVGFKKRRTINFSSVQDGGQAQRLARLAINGAQFQGEFRATFNYRPLKAENWNCVRLNFPRYGFANKLFRVIRWALPARGGIELTLKEESASIYTEVTPLPTPAPGVGTGADPYAKEAVTGLSAIPYGVAGGGGTAVDAVRASWTSGSGKIARTEVRFCKRPTSGLTADAVWQSGPSVLEDQRETVIAPLQPSTLYWVEVRHISVFGIPGDWARYQVTTNAVTVSPSGYITYADGTPIESLRPAEAGANVTETRVAASITGQGTWATASVPGGLTPTLVGDRTQHLHNTTGALDNLTSVTTRPFTALTARTADNLTYVSGGATVESLRPGEAGANVTETRVAASFTGQTRFATAVSLSLADADIAAPWSALDSRPPVSLLAVTEDERCVDTSAWTAMLGTALSTLETISDGVTGNTVFRSPVGVQSWHGSARTVPIDPNKTYRVTCLARRSATANGIFYLAADLRDSSDAYIGGDGTLWFYAASGVFPGTTFVRYEGFFGAGTARTLASTARGMRAAVLLNISGTLGYYEVQDLKIEEVHRLGGSIRREDGSTVLTDAAAVTSLGTAAAITGQGTWATASVPGGLTPTLVGDRTQHLHNTTGALDNLTSITTRPLSALTGRTADQITFVTGGATVDSLKPAEAAADVTGGHVAASVTGQTGWATDTTRTPAQLVGAISTDGVALKLTTASGLAVGPGVTTPLAGQPYTIQAGDGEAVSFAVAYGVPPLVIPVSSDNLIAMTSAGDYYQTAPGNVTTTGFIGQARKKNPGSGGTPTARTDDGSGDASTIANASVHYRHKELSGVSQNGRYLASFQIKTTGKRDAPSEPIYPRSMVVGFYGRQTSGGAWVLLASASYSSNVGLTTVTATKTLDGTNAWTSWTPYSGSDPAGFEYKIEVISGYVADEMCLYDFTSVAWTELVGGSGATDVTALADGRKLTYLVFPLAG